MRSRHGRATVCGEPPERHCPRRGWEGSGKRQQSASQDTDANVDRTIRLAQRKGLPCLLRIVAASSRHCHRLPVTHAQRRSRDRARRHERPQPRVRARTARTTYVVTAAQIARDGDRTVADALERVPGVDVVRYGAFGAATSVGIRGSSSQQVLVLVDGLPMAGSQINDVNLEQFAGRRDRSDRGRRGRRLDALRFRLHRRRDQHHHGAAAGAQRTPRSATGSFNEQTLSASNAVRHVSTHVRDERLFRGRTDRTAQNAQAGLTAVSARYAHAIGGARIHPYAATIADAIVRRAGRARTSSRRPANRATSIATCD